jgi:chloride channel protein, CIC family
VAHVKRTLKLAQHRQAELNSLAQRSREVVLVAAVTGALTGLVVALFDRLVAEDLFPRVLEAPLWLAAVTPVAGIAAGAILLHWWKIGPGTADEYLKAYHERSHVLRLSHLVVRGLAAVLTLGAGAPMGLEGPSIFAGANIGSNIQRRLPKPFRHADHRTLLVAGAAAGVAAIFKAPATGVVFALEVPYRDDLARRMLLPASVAAATGYLVFASINGTDPIFDTGATLGFELRDVLGAIALGAVAGLGARLFASGIMRAKRLADRPVWFRLGLFGPAMIALFVLSRLATGESLTLGSGYEVIRWTSEGDHPLWMLGAILAIRCLATISAVGAGGVGGVFIPLAVGGALVGRITGDLVHTLDPGLFTVVGVAAFLGAGYRVPLAGVMFVAETTGQPGFVVPGLIAAVAAELMMGASSITPYQRAPKGGD